MTEPTPGPWQVGRDTPNGLQIDTDGGTICTGVTWRPNAALIADAPALLDALEAAECAARHMADCDGGEGDDQCDLDNGWLCVEGDRLYTEAENARRTLLRKHGRLP